MFRTTIMLPQDLKSQAEEKARQLGVSLGEFIRKSMWFSLKAVPKNRDSFLGDHALYTGKVPKDLSARHDDYLYGGRQ